MSDPDISVVVPLYNEQDNLRAFFDGLNTALGRTSRAFDLIFVNDGSSDRSQEILEDIYSRHENVTVVSLYRNEGKAAALEVGMSLAEGRYIANIDSDFQYDPKDILTLVAELERGADVASGRRTSRSDSRSVIVTSRLFNFVMKTLTGLAFHDFFSGLKCYRKTVIRYLSLYGDLYRFASIYAHRQGFRVVEVPIVHHERAGGLSRYRFSSRLRMSIADVGTTLLTVVFNQDRVYYMGLGGLALLSVGAWLVSAAWLLAYFGAGTVAQRFSLQFAGMAMLFLAVQILILKKVSQDFFARHQDERQRRKRNIRQVLRRGWSHEIGPLESGAQGLVMADSPGGLAKHVYQRD